jgi:hypothetical protein
MQKTDSLYKWVRALHIVVALALPLGVLLIVGFTPRALYFSFGSVWDVVAYAAYWFMAMPIFAVYGGIAAIRFFPTKARDILLLFLPALVGFGASFSFDGTAQVLATVTTQAAVLYIGLYILLIVGLMPLVVSTFRDDVKDASRSTVMRQAAARLFVLALMLSPIFYTLLYAHNVGREALASIDDGEAWRVWFFYAHMLFVAAAYFPRFIQLYKEGRL